MAKIAIIFPRFSGPYGGENIAINTAGELDNLGHRVDLYTTYFSQDIRRFIKPTVKIIESPRLVINNHNLANFFVYFFMPVLASKIKGSYDLILGQTWQAALALWWLKVIKRTKAKLIYHCFEPPRFLYDLKKERGLLAKLISPIIKPMDKIAVKFGNHTIISISDLVRKWVKEIYQRDSVIVYPGVEVERFQKYSCKEARRRLGLKKDEEIFLSVSKLHPRKRLKWAMRIYKRTRRDQNSLLIIAGSGPYENELKKYAQKIGITDRTRFIGVISGEAVVLYNAAADYFLFTAKNEPFGIAPQEARVAGVKVLPKGRPYPILTWQESTKNLLSKIGLDDKQQL